MEPDVSIETCSMIRIIVIPIGTIHPSHFRKYVAMLGRHRNVELSAISSFYTKHKKSPFPQQPWDSGNLRFKYVIGESPPSPWEDFQAYRKIHAVIGICHCPSSPDLETVLLQFVDACKGYASSFVQRCFAFSPADSQLEKESNKPNKLILFPPADQRTQEFHLQTMMQDIAASLLMEFEKWVLEAESGRTLLKTPLDSQASLSAEEAIKAKKRRNARAQKTIGDYCLLAGSPLDANAHYCTALELSRMIGDYFWYAGALEGGVCAFWMDKAGKKDPGLVEEVKYRYNGVIMHYRKSVMQENDQRVSALSFELEATLKLARFLCRPEMVKEVVDLLTNASDGAKSLIDPDDRLILYVEIARLFGNLGYHRKAAFFSRQVAKLYLQQQNNLAASSALQILAITTKAYRVETRATISIHNVSNETGIDNGKMRHQLVVSLFESQWSTLQMIVLKEILLSAVRAGDPLAAWSAAARLLRSYYPLITPPAQNGLVTALVNSADCLPSGTHCPDPALPFIRLHSFPLHSSQTDIIKRNPKRDDWWAGAVPSGPFIYTPFTKKDSTSTAKHSLIWVIGEPVQVLVELANPCGFDLIVNSIYLSVHSGNFDAFPVTVTLNSNASKIIIPVEQAHILLSGKNQHSVISVGFENLKSALPLKPGAEVIIPVTLKAWEIGSDASSPMLIIYYTGPSGNYGEPPPDGGVVPPGRRLVTPLNICVQQGLTFMKVRLLKMEIPAQISENVLDKKTDKLVKIDPFGGSWGLRFLELELHNPTDVVFEVSVSVQLEKTNNENYSEFSYPKTRIDRDYSSRVLIPLEHFKLPVLDGSVLINNNSQANGGNNAKSELNALIKDMISKIKVRWQSGRNSSGELHIKDATQAALQSSVMEVLLPDPLTFRFGLAKEVDFEDSVKGMKEYDVLANYMTAMEVRVRNNTKDSIKMSLSVTCRDVTGENCIEGNNPTVLWAGTLNAVKVDIPPLKEIKHPFSLYFLVPGEYTLLAAAMIDDPNDILRARAHSASSDESVFCRGPPYHVRVHGIRIVDLSPAIVSILETLCSNQIL
ncbi:hypothetical protein L1987_84487 [Smallanthus sonchifolius]|uniref:Uncharacterized protein n=1 Tax=Smallanthus sonchifolius TaxID=185202 RepID=A0ACB8YEV0_9ASTR|nr:hypothetical protein L1987_84487 [Smallanthus sonchifolius]